MIPILLTDHNGKLFLVNANRIETAGQHVDRQGVKTTRVYTFDRPEAPLVVAEHPAEIKNRIIEQTK